MQVKYVVLIVIFSLSMFTIAGMLNYLGEAPFWPTYLSLAISEAVALIVGGLVIYPIGRRIDLS